MLSRHSSIRVCAVMVGCACVVSFAQAQQRTQTGPPPRTNSSAGAQREGDSRLSPQTRTRSQTPARTVSSSQGRAARVVADAPVSAEMQQLLEAWHGSSSLIKRLEGKHIRRIYDTVFSIEKRSVGQFFYEAPDSGRIDIDEYSVKADEVSQRLKPDKTPFKLQSDKPEQWICDGKQIFSINRQDKQAEVFEIPVAARGENIMNGPLPFLFGMPPEMAKQRYHLTLLSPLKKGQKSVQLKAVPKWKQDAANWQEAKIILDRESFLPLHIQLKDPTGNTITVYSFGNMIVNKAARSLIFKRDPFKPSLLGYKVNAHNEETMKADLEKRRQDGEALRGELEKARATAAKPVTPDVRGYTWRDGKERLERMGLTVKILRGPVARSQKDVFHVASQIPSAMAPLPTDKVVKLVVYTAPKTAGTKSGSGTR